MHIEIKVLEENIKTYAVIYTNQINDEILQIVDMIGNMNDVITAMDEDRSTDKSYPGDNRLITPKSSHRRSGLAPRCRLIASWGCSRSQGLGCSPIKAVRELGSERREKVRSLSGAGVRCLRGAALSTRGPGWTDRWCICCISRCKRQGSQVRQG